MFKKLSARKKSSLNVGGILSVAAAVCLIYYLLITNRFLPFCISPVLSWKHWHLLAIGLVPIFLALVFFGVVLISSYFGNALQRWLSELWHGNKFHH